MRKIGHKVDVDLLRDDYNDYRKDLKPNASERKEAKRSGDAQYFIDRVGTTIEVARLGYLFDMPFDEIAELLRKNLPDLQIAIEIGGVLSPVQMLDYFGAMMVTGDKDLVRWFAELPKDSYEEEDMEVSDAFFALIPALQAGMVGDTKRFASQISKFAELLNTKKLKVDPASEKAIYEPIAALLRAIAANDQDAFDSAWQQKAVAWKRRYGRPSESANMDGLLDLSALGIGLLAAKLKLIVANENPYAPQGLLQTGTRS